MKAIALVSVLSLVVLGACTTLGPMAATTAVSPVPANRPGAEVQVGVVPGFMLSDATHAVHGTPVGEVSGLVEPDTMVGIPGLVVGARQVGSEGNTVFEPFAGIRRKLDDDLSIAAIAFGTHGQGEASHASYEATRAGAEISADARVLTSRFIDLHAQAAVSLTGLWASGTYCVATTGEGIDCNGDANDRVVDARLSGVYVGATTGLSLDLFRSQESVIHVVRLAAMLGFGAMPRVRDGKQEAGDAYVSGGMTLTVGLGRAH
jgi:hypothetical protein